MQTVVLHSLIDLTGSYQCIDYVHINSSALVKISNDITVISSAVRKVSLFRQNKPYRF